MRISKAGFSGVDISLLNLLISATTALFSPAIISATPDNPVSLSYR